MAADLHIHIKTDDIKEENMRAFFQSCMGSKYFNMFSRMDYETERKLSEPINKSPNIWVGEVSWLKAGLTEDSESFIPTTVAKIQELIGDREPIIDDNLIEQITKAFDLRNATGYSLNTKSVVKKFLLKHKGKKIFTISW